MYRHQRQGWCSLQQVNIYEVDRDSHPAFCQHIGWTDPPKFGRCVPAKQGPKKASNRTTHTTSNTTSNTTPHTTSNTTSNTTSKTTPIEIYTVQADYKIPKKAPPADPEEEREIISSEDETPQPMVASKICRTKRARSESPAAELRRAIERTNGGGRRARTEGKDIKGRD